MAVAYIYNYVYNYLALFHSLQDYKETCFAYYKSLVMADSDDKRIISANWAKDEDINRYKYCCLYFDILALTMN